MIDFERARSIHEQRAALRRVGATPEEVSMVMAERAALAERSRKCAAFLEEQLRSWPIPVREAVMAEVRRDGFDLEEFERARSGASVHAQETPALAIRFELLDYRDALADWRRARSPSWSTVRYRRVRRVRGRLLRALWLYGVRKLDAGIRGARA